MTVEIRGRFFRSKLNVMHSHKGFFLSVQGIEKINEGKSLQKKAQNKN